MSPRDVVAETRSGCGSWHTEANSLDKAINAAHLDPRGDRAPRQLMMIVTNAESTFCDPILDVLYANFVAAVGRSAEPTPRSSPQNSGLWFVSGDLGDVHGDCVDGMPRADCDIRAASFYRPPRCSSTATAAGSSARPTGRSQDHD